jgi:glutathione S-transferase
MEKTGRFSKAPTPEDPKRVSIFESEAILEYMAKSSIVADSPS